MKKELGGRKEDANSELKGKELIYSLTESEKIFEGEKLNLYGVEVILKNKDQSYSEKYLDLSTSREKILSTIELLKRNNVTPYGLHDVIEEIFY